MTFLWLLVHPHAAMRKAEWLLDYLERHFDEPTVERLAVRCAAITMSGVALMYVTMCWMKR